MMNMQKVIAKRHSIALSSLLFSDGRVIPAASLGGFEKEMKKLNKKFAKRRRKLMRKFSKLAYPTGAS